MTSNIDAKKRKQLSMQFTKDVKIETWEPYKNPNKRVSNKHFKDNYAVLRMWNMVEYDTVIAIDADMLATQSLDYLCNLNVPIGSVAASNNWWTSKRDWDNTVFNGGLMVLHPSKETFASMQINAKTFKSPSGGVQPFLNHYFKNKWIKLNPKIWGMNANSFALRPETWDDSKIHAIHYTTKAKPCHTSPGSFITKSFNHPYRHWHRVFDKMRHDKFKGSLHIINNDINKKVSTDYEKYMDMQTSQALPSHTPY